MRSLISKKIGAFLLTLLVIAPVGLLIPTPTPAYAASPAESVSTTSSGCWSFTVEGCVRSILATAAEAILSVCAFLLWVAGSLLSGVVDLTIVKMSMVMNPTANAPSSITIAWGLFRDIGNIFLIFALLTVGISVILGIEGYGIKSLLPKIIIVAVLINFSLFFCKAAIDFTNIVSLQFYDSIMTAAEKTNEKRNTNLGLGALVMDNLRLSSLYGKTTNDSVDATSFGLKKDGVTIGVVLLVGVAGSILFMVVTAIFLAASLALISRFITLLFLTTLSSLALVALILPSTRKYWDQWLESFIHNAFFAPLYMVLLWASFQIVSGLKIERILNANTLQTVDLSQLASGNPGATGPVLINFIIVCGFFVGSLIIAKQLGAVGAAGALNGLSAIRKSVQGTVVKYTRGAAFAPVNYAAAGAGLAGRNFIGRWGAYRAQDSALLDKASKGGVGGLYARGKLAIARNAASATFDPRNLSTVKKGAEKLGLELPEIEGGFEERQEEKKKAAKKYADSLDKVDVKSKEEAAKKVEGPLTDTVEENKKKVQAAKQDLETAKQKVDKAKQEYQFLKDKKGVTNDELERGAADVRSAQAGVDTALILSKDADAALAQSEKELAQAKKDSAKEIEKIKNSRQTQYANEVINGYGEVWTGIAKQKREEVVDAIKKTKAKDAKLLDDLKAFAKEDTKK